jgi:hypothetical protein
MANNKTTETDKDVSDFISGFAVTEQKRKDSYELIELMKNVSGYEAKMWGPSIIGFGRYHYRYESGHEGDAPYIGFSPRKAAISLYVHTGLKEHEYLLEDFGKFRIGKSCIYIRKLSDIDRQKLVALMNATIKHLKLNYNKDYCSH